MATASKRITRKELRQPDWFQVTTEKSLEFVRQNRTMVLAAVAAVVAILLVISGWQVFKARQNAAASKEFGSAISLYQSQKYREAIAEFQKVQAYRWSRYAALAHLYQANSHFGLGEWKQAGASAERFLSATGPDTLYRQMALMTLAAVEEQTDDCKKAAARYSEAVNIKGAFQQQARLGKARCAEKNGDLQSAIAALKDYLKETPDTMLELRIAALEAKAGAEVKKAE